MELDEFKAHWNEIQDKAFEQQRLTENKLNQIIMKTTVTLNQLYQKSAYWNKLSETICKILLGVLIPVSLIVLIKACIFPGKASHFNEALVQVGISFIYIAIIVTYCLVTMWVFRRQQQIFTRDNNDNIKNALAETITAFKKFYIKLNIIYLFLYPVYFYSVIKLLMPYWKPSADTVLITCGILTIIFLVLGYVYYKIKYLNRIKLLSGNLKELE